MVTGASWWKKIGSSDKSDTGATLVLFVEPSLVAVGLFDMFHAGLWDMSPYKQNSVWGSSYPEGNFGGNQLLDGSISLSPLYPSQTNDLHVSIAAGLHQSFLWLRPAQA
ncbi:hypothetical protein KFK09_022651 [Dendrobium nobile]|uniref:Uncharacterized protein n=1 Tax=Dendrobium nobile TaxID=94219 RepID=A0A8T3AQG9_DENNO|nr:hypothetical protein KFK09_022651 [Dendrobium nobile]